MGIEARSVAGGDDRVIHAGAGWAIQDEGLGCEAPERNRAIFCALREWMTGRQSHHHRFVEQRLDCEPLCIGGFCANERNIHSLIAQTIEQLIYSGTPPR